MSRPTTETFTDSQLIQLKELFDTNPVSEGRALDEIRRMLDHSDLSVGVLDEDSNVIGVGRVLTDFVYKAWIFDVRVKTQYHNQGVGKQIIQHIFNHPTLKEVKTFDLICRDETAPFYKNLGFSDVLENRNYLRYSR